MNIRELEKKDYTKYLELINDFRPIGVSINKGQFDNLYDEIFKKDVIYVYEIIVGTVKLLIEQKIIHKLSKYGRIEDIIVKKDYRNKGIGSTMIKHIIDYCRENNFFKLSLSCSEDLSKFYQANNFKVYQLNMSQLL